MHVHRILIRNFRNFETLLVDDLPAALVVVGENGAGKTNLLVALRLVLDPSLPDSARELRHEDFSSGTADAMQGAEIRVEVDVAGFDDDEEAKGTLADGIVNADPIVARLTYYFRPKESLNVDAGYEFATFLGTDESPEPFGADVRRFVSLRVLPALRDAEGDLRSSSRSPLRQLLTSLDVPDESPR